MRTWIPLSQWAALVGVSYSRAQQWVQEGRIRTRVHYGRRMVRRDEPRPVDRRRKENKA